MDLSAHHLCVLDVGVVGVEVMKKGHVGGEGQGRKERERERAYVRDETGEWSE